ncbi:50S ribosomal protein L17 [Candidatus Parcubacteria bacterium]|jgi:large subunit ribosomal protein L17|nr:MAG: 50S ribosomal protein L17 [Candidatus Parcubacteria bacterium]
MRHRKTKSVIDRKAAPRRALIRHLAEAFIVQGQVKSSPVKIRVVQRVVEKAITLARTNTLASRRKLLQAFSEKSVKKLLEDLGPKYKDRKGGYTRRIHAGPRRGDNSQQVYLELV